MSNITRRTLNQRPASALLWAMAIAMAALVAAGGRAAEPQDVFPTPVYVTLQGSGAVENMATGKTWHDLTSAHYDALSPDGSRVLVSSATTPDAFLVDTKTGKALKTFDIGPVLQGVKISPNGKWGLVVSAGKGTVSIINLHTGQLVTTIPVGMGPNHAPIGSGPHNAIFTPDSKLAYVTLQGGGGMAVLDMDTLRLTDQFPLAGIELPHNLVLSPDGKTLWIRGFVGQVAAVDVKSHKVLAVIPVGASHAGIDITANGRYVFTGGIGGKRVDVIDTQTFKVVKRIDVGPGPHGVRVSRDQRWVYAGVTGTAKIAVINARTFKVVRQIPTNGKVPFWLAAPRHD